MLNDQKILEEEDKLTQKGRKRFDRIMNVAEKYVVCPGKSEPSKDYPIFNSVIRDELFSKNNSTIIYESILEEIKKHLRPGFEVRKFEIEFIVGFLYPKLDFNVSASTNHLLKAPFNIHHASQNLSVPLINVKDFDIKNCLTINDLICDRNDAFKGKGRLNHSFKDYLKKMESFCKSLEASKNEEKQNEGAKIEF